MSHARKCRAGTLSVELPLPRSKRCGGSEGRAMKVGARAQSGSKRAATNTAAVHSLTSGITYLLSLTVVCTVSVGLT